MMMDLDKIKEQMGDVLKQMDVCYGKAEAAEAAGDAEELKLANETLDGLKGKFEALKAKSVEAEAHKERLDYQKRIVELATVNKAADELPAEGAPEGKAVDHKRNEREYTDLFGKWLVGGEVSDRARAAMTPAGKGWVQGAEGVKLPRWMAKLALNGLSNRPGAAGKAATMTSTTLSALIPEEYSAELQIVAAEPNAPWSWVRQVPCNTGTVTWPRFTQTDSDEYGGIVGEWINEAGEKPLTDASFDQVPISTHEYAAYTELSNTVLRRSILDLTVFLSTEFPMVIGNALSIAVLTGTGTGQPLGVTIDASVRATRFVARQTANALVYDDFVNLKYALRSYHRQGASFVIADDAMQYVEKIKDLDGRPIFSQTVGSGMYDRVLGYPFTTTHRLTLGDEDVVFGNWRAGYVAPVEQDVVILKSTDYKFRNNVTSFAVFVQAGGRPMQPRLFSVLGDVEGS